MTPQLVTAPQDPVCSLDEMRTHLRLDDTESDVELAALEAAAVGYLDGWRGVLGRAIVSQVWSQEFTGWGDLEIEMPDVASFTVSGFDTEDAPVAASSSELINTYAGPIVRCSGPAVSRVVVEYTVGMPAAQLKTAKVLVLLMVANWFDNRSGDAALELPASARSLIEILRWRVI